MQGQPELVTVTTPRNMKQLRNLRHKQLQQSRICHDDIYNLAYDIPGYVKKIMTFPDLVCICGVQEVLEEMDRVLLLGSNEQLLSYDTMFQLGDFYVSPLLFWHTLFKENPCIPAMFLLHECKFTDMHKKLKQCVKNIPAFNKANYPLVTDRKQAITNAIKTEAPNLTLLYCWNHVFGDMRCWLHNCGVPSADISMY